MPKMVMKTDKFEITNEYVDLSSLKNGTYFYDDRLDMVVPVEAKNDPWDLFRNYLHSFCTLTNEHKEGRAAEYTACGMLPIGIEPVILGGQVNWQFIIPRLKESGIEYFQITPVSPIRRNYAPSSVFSAQDIWVSKLDAAKKVNKPIHNVNTMDLLEVLGIC